MYVTVTDHMSSNLLTSPFTECKHGRRKMRSRPSLGKWPESIESAHNGVISLILQELMSTVALVTAELPGVVLWEAVERKSSVQGDYGSCGPEPAQVQWMSPVTNGDSTVNDSFVTRWNLVLESVPNKGCCFARVDIALWRVFESFHSVTGVLAHLR